jgi:hypothetical protein
VLFSRVAAACTHAHVIAVLIGWLHSIRSALILSRTCDCTSETPLQKRMNLTKTIRKTPVDLNLETAGTTYVDPGNKPQPKYDDEDKWVSARPFYGAAYGMRLGVCVARQQFAPRCGMMCGLYRRGKTDVKATACMLHETSRYCCTAGPSLNAGLQHHSGTDSRCGDTICLLSPCVSPCAVAPTGPDAAHQSQANCLTFLIEVPISG